MRKILLLIGLFAITFPFAYTQCTPNPIFVATGIPGLWPNPAMGSLPDGEINVPYNQTITVIVVQDTTIDLSQVVGFPIPPVQVSVNYQQITGVTGLPAGMSYVCDTSSCTWPGGGSGCMKMSGTPTQAGNFVVDVVTSLNVDVPASVPVIGGSAIDIPVPGVSYDLYVDNPNSLDDFNNHQFAVSQNIPNPFSGITEIQYQTLTPAVMQLEVVNMTGQRVHTQTLRASAGTNQISLDANGWKPGVYFYSLSDGESKITRKLVVM